MLPNKRVIHWRTRIEVRLVVVTSISRNLVGLRQKILAEGPWRLLFEIPQSRNSNTTPCKRSSHTTAKMAPKKNTKAADSINAKLALTIKVS